jgi:hypothetical protein
MATQRANREVVRDPHAQLEQTFIAEYLRERGYSLADLHKLPKRLAQQLMAEASTYASNRLSEMEARAHFVQEIHGP